MNFNSFIFLHEDTKELNIKLYIFFLAFNMGKIAIAGGSLVGVGALCFYGLGLSNQPGAIDRAA